MGLSKCSLGFPTVIDQLIFVLTIAAAVQRLSQTWELLSEKYQAKWQKLNQHLKNNYKGLRERLVSMPPPCIPFLGTFLTDLTFIGTTNYSHSLTFFRGRFAENTFQWTYQFHQVSIGGWHVTDNHAVPIQPIFIPTSCPHL